MKYLLFFFFRSLERTLRKKTKTTNGLLHNSAIKREIYTHILRKERLKEKNKTQESNSVSNQIEQDKRSKKKEDKEKVVVKYRKAMNDK